VYERESLTFLHNHLQQDRSLGGDRLGIAFGIVLTRPEALSWFRIQEMFRVQSFRMYGIIGSAVATAAVSLAAIMWAGLKTVLGESISVPARTLGSGIQYAAGGTILLLGWALTGACPGPLIAFIGNGVTAMPVAVASALAGPREYGWLCPHLTHRCRFNLSRSPRSPSLVFTEHDNWCRIGIIIFRRTARFSRFATHLLFKHTRTAND
jgi:hypothetical protein